MRTLPLGMQGASADRLSELEFTDLYLGHPRLEDRIAESPGAAVCPLAAGAALREDVRGLIEACNVERQRVSEAADFKIGYDGANYRVSILPAQGGEVFVVKRIASKVASLAELGVPQAYIRRMMMRELSGLFIVSGAISSGKTMTACAMLKERLGTLGGIAATGENPIELSIEGSHGRGLCFQTELPVGQGGFTEGFRNMTRWRAGTLLIGEIRDGESAEVLLKASMSGYLVITTMLADDVVRTVVRLQAMLTERLGAEAGRTLLADGLAGVLHQRLVRDTRHAPRLDAQMLFLKDAPLTRAVLRKGEFEQLTTEVSKQMATMIAENASASRHGVN